MKSPYYRFSQYLKERFHCKVYKINIDAGFSCPNRDGTLSKEGCIFCDNRGFNVFNRLSTKDIRAQINEGMQFYRKRYQADKFIIYFQTFTNTYAPLEILEEKYKIIEEFSDVVGLSIATRPDCINEDILELIDKFTCKYEVWIEYGLQSVHNSTLNLINRGHTYEKFLETFDLTRKKSKIKICVHLIVGLPGEDLEMVKYTFKEMGRIEVDGIKIHPLHVIKDTPLHRLYLEGKYTPLSMQEYVDTVVEVLQYLAPSTVIQRLTATCSPQILVAPMWINKRSEVLRSIESKCRQENKFQSKLYK